MSSECEIGTVPMPSEALTQTLVTSAEILYSHLPPPAFNQNKILKQRQGEQLACTGNSRSAFLWQCHESLRLA